MSERRFTDPFGSKLPALEQNILKLRAMQMVLVMFYAEELRREALACIRLPTGTKNALKKSLTRLVNDGAISTAEKLEIEKLIDYRNDVGHRLQNLLLDLSPERVAREMLTYTPELIPRYDYDAVKRLQHFLQRFDGFYRTHHYVVELNFNRLLFASAEKTFLTETKRLQRKILRLGKVRQASIKRLNNELSLKDTSRRPHFPSTSWRQRANERVAEPATASPTSVAACCNRAGSKLSVSWFQTPHVTSTVPTRMCAMRRHTPAPFG